MPMIFLWKFYWLEISQEWLCITQILLSHRTAKFKMWFAINNAYGMFMLIWFSPKSPLHHPEYPWTQRKDDKFLMTWDAEKQMQGQFLWPCMSVVENGGLIDRIAFDSVLVNAEFAFHSWIIFLCVCRSH